MSSRAHEAVKEFHEIYSVPMRDSPGLPPLLIRNLRKSLIMEEALEIYEAIIRDDIIEIADGLADLVYILYGTALAYGIPLDDVIEEVHRSNLTKLGEDGKPIYSEHGKVTKGPNFEPPNIQKVLETRGKI